MCQLTDSQLKEEAYLRNIHPGSCGLWYCRVGWLVGLFDGVVLSLHLGLSLATRQLYPYGSAYEDPGLDDPEGYLRPKRSQLPA